MEKMFHPDKFAEIYDAYYKKCFLFTKSYVHEKQAAEDIASDSFIHLYEALQKGEEIKNIPAYLLTLVKNKAVDYLRQKTIRMRTHETFSNIDAEELEYRISTLEGCNPELIYSKEIQQIVDATLKQLSPKTREIFRMSRYENYSNKQIATELNIHIKTVEYHITQSLQLLRRNLKDYLPLFYFFFYF
ncbi:MAG TPA: RNA polymerase sigma-70 factor [Porphyromonadaceae bacterium]|jgi:RNA polymerase sigma-70 factor (ECF subfamily)|uniref:RNA polymerase sigma-70 factor n=1 Tax=Limibacterium fermenti TaxID=3229863 RepID=UPI000E8AE778|nr:RNA polymerase sigma-70 factor [Porphyromonadaceae bacterium]HBK30473.1 RNA polymerase sigma-70 factor [Porphyromonadaceae bacterium]HBL32967.1 RNA polymerase sigma-70 factor [Porphyromonadaceae bacterium]HBX20890.1 RNA polymerase sigma-70 factor [Porphyromonadaceae bacterium]HBX47042.1 RNA polymerase sigma-70 factor [Porphyromonadaceae bacterium]